MSYSVKYKDSSKDPIIVSDGKVDTTTDLWLLGRNFPGYGEKIAENFLNLLENFSSPNSPPKPIEGQLWYDTNDLKLKFYDHFGIWRPLSTINVSTENPSGPGNSNGDIWFDIENNILYIFVENQWYPIIYTSPDTNVMSKIRQDINGIFHKTLELVVNNKTTIVMCSDDEDWIPLSSGPEAEILPNNQLMAAEFPLIKQGSNLNTTENYVYHGTATSALYADLAERYRADRVLVPGTVVRLGGTQEITEEIHEASTEIFGVISSQPAFMMNSNAGTDETHPYVALSGRVPCRVTGFVNKGARLTSSNIPGVARAATEEESQDYRKIIGRAVAGSPNTEIEHLIEIVVGAK